MYVQTAFESSDFRVQKLDGHNDYQNIWFDSAGQHRIPGQAEAEEHLPGPGMTK